MPVTAAAEAAAEAAAAAASDAASAGYPSQPVSPCRTENTGRAGDNPIVGTPDSARGAASDSVLGMSEIEIARAILGFQHHVPEQDTGILVSDSDSALVPWAKKKKL